MVIVGDASWAFFGSLGSGFESTLGACDRDTQVTETKMDGFERVVAPPDKCVSNCTVANAGLSGAVT